MGAAYSKQLTEEGLKVQIQARKETTSPSKLLYEIREKSLLSRSHCLNNHLQPNNTFKRKEGLGLGFQCFLLLLYCCSFYSCLCLHNIWKTLEPAYRLQQSPWGVWSWGIRQYEIKRSGSNEGRRFLPFHLESCRHHCSWCHIQIRFSSTHWLAFYCPVAAWVTVPDSWQTIKTDFILKTFPLFSTAVYCCHLLVTTWDSWCLFNRAKLVIMTWYPQFCKFTLIPEQRLVY